MEPLGFDLKAIRENKNITLREIAEGTRINLTYLKNIEEGRYGDLPGGIYNRAFLRAYCEYLGLESNEYLARYEAELAPPSDKVPKHKPKSINHHPVELSLHPLFMWGSMLLVSVLGLYFSRHWISAVFSPYFSRSPVSRITPQDLPGPKPPEPQLTPVAGSASAPASQPQASQGKTDSSEYAVSPPSLSDQARGTAAPVAPPPQVPGTIRLEFKVVEQCWVSVNSDGNRVVSRLLEPGDDQFFDATQRFYLILGNAGGVHLKINGKAARPLGKSGDVVRIIINEQNLPDLLEKTPG
jgi:cytoskeleton protein RodZ